ncbi:MAG: hypothetical protein M1814_003472 [Vezdaea aestivalis]|nr:MAG: hypothetical protein M1814_003472 [Vezdaea aestivalis]
MGDSYASGVGAGPQPPDDTNRCFRFPNAYPVVAQSQLKPAPLKFNNVACSGNTFQQIKDKELLDTPENDGRYGTRPPWGKDPEFVSITMGGNDVGILNLISTCILSFKLWGMDCEEVIKSGHDIIQSQKFQQDLNDLIQAVVDKGRKTSLGNRFKVFVVGYAQFFNQQRTQCNDVTFKPSWNPLPAQKLTIDRRTKMNQLALALNKALSDASNHFKDQGVYYVDYDKQYEGHRFCDRDEPAPNDPETYFFNWYTKDDPKLAQVQKIFEKMPTYIATIKSGGSKQGAFKTDQDYIDALATAAGNDIESQSLMSDSVRIFHPTTRGHQQIRDVLLKSLNDNGVGGASAPASPSQPQHPQCHGVGGDFWMLSRDQAVSAAEQFCRQTVKDKEYFQGSADSVKLSLHNKDDSKPISGIQNCVGDFKIIIDGCDGNDPLNNPHNYKFGGKYTTPNGWTFSVQPTAIKPDENSCDVSYKLLLNEFEVRGKNFPDARLGADGGGLKSQIQGCGALTEWHFEWTPKDVKYQWYAKGHLPIGTKACMGRAVLSAGGTSKGNCHGAG